MYAEDRGRRCASFSIDHHYFISLQQALPLNLELSWQPVKPASSYVHSLWSWGSRQHVEAFYVVTGDLYSDPHPTHQALGPRIHLASPLRGEMSLCPFLGSGKRAFLLRLLRRREWVLWFPPVMPQIGTNA